MNAESKEYPGWHELTPEQQNRGVKVRIVARIAMCVAILPCLVALVIGFWLGIMTVKQLTTTQLLPLAGVVVAEQPSTASDERAQQSDDLIPGQRRGFLDRIIDADISTVSALIVWVTSLLMLWHSYRFFWRSRGRPKSVEQYGSRQTVFFPTYQRFCVRLGLLGTFASMALIALGQDKLDAEKIFPLLCASIFSTFVGCLTGYLAIPAIEGINAFALGQHQLPRPQTLQEQLNQEVETAITGIRKFSGAVDQLTTKLTTVDQMATQLASLEMSVRGLTAALVTVETKAKQRDAKIEQIVQTTAANTRQLAEATAALDATAQNVQRISAANSESAKQLNDSCKQLDRSTRSLGKLVRASRKFFVSVRQHIRKGTEFLGSSRKHTQRAADAMDGLLSEQESLGKEVRTLNQKAEKMHKSLSANLDRIEKRQSTQQREAADLTAHVARTRETVESLAATNGATHASPNRKRSGGLFGRWRR